MRHTVTHSDGRFFFAHPHLVEFILRTCKVLEIDNPTCKNILVNDLHYGVDGSGKLNIKFIEKVKPNKTNTVFNLANPEFFREEIEW